MYPGKSKQWDWRSEVKEKMKEVRPRGSIKELRNYTLIEGKLYRRLLGGILSRCINEKEGKFRLEELHTQACGIAEKISLYRRMQCMGYYWPNMNKEATTIQEKCQECQLSINKEESYAVFVTEDWRISFMKYLAQGILPTNRTLAHQLKKFYGQVLFAERDPIHKGIQWGSPKMPGAKGSQGNSQGGPFW